MDSNYINNDDTLVFHMSEPTNSYELDFSKIKTVNDCVLLLKAFICGFNHGYEPKIIINDTSILYEELKHLAKDE